MFQPKFFYISGDFFGLTIAEPIILADGQMIQPSFRWELGAYPLTPEVRNIRVEDMKELTPEQFFENIGSMNDSLHLIKGQGSEPHGTIQNKQVFCCEGHVKGKAMTCDDCGKTMSWGDSNSTYNATQEIWQCRCNRCHNLRQEM